MLHGVSVLVAGAGLAGLTAARDLADMGAAVTVIDPRERVGGRVHTVRNGFSANQHAEAGADLIDEAHTELIQLIESLGLKLVHILKHGWAYVRPDEHGHPKPVPRDEAHGWERLATALAPLAERYRLAERRWESPIIQAMARQSVQQWLDSSHADAALRASAEGLRGFFLADPDELSLVALVDQFASDTAPAAARAFRVHGGNDQIAIQLANALGDRLRLGTELVALSQRGQRVRASLKHKRQAQQLTCDYVVCTLPATVLRRIPMTPALPAQQHEAIATLKYGRATRSLLQFSSRFWKVPGQPSAYGSPLPMGAVWDGNEEQRGKPAILSLLAGGSASDATVEMVGRDGPPALARQLEWLGAHRAQLLAAHSVTWDADPHARGGYAFFDPGFKPELRRWLAQPFGRLFFAGEHTSLRWQGYMNGAVASGRRAAAEVAASHALGGTTSRG